MPGGPHPSVAELAAQLQKALDAALHQNQRLADQIKEFEARADDAERRARETQEKLQILESLKTKEYQKVVTELFEGPSRRAAQLTLVVAIASIIIGLAQNLVSNRVSSRDNAEAIARFSESLRTQFRDDLQMNLTQTKQDVRTMLGDLRRDGDSALTPLILRSGEQVDGLIGRDSHQYYAIEVPTDATRLDVTLRYSAPSHAHIYVRHDKIKAERVNWSQKLVTREQCSNGHSGSPDHCAFERPEKGMWIVQVRGFPPENSTTSTTSTTTDVSATAPKVAPSPALPPVAQLSAFQITASVR